MVETIAGSGAAAAKTQIWWTMPQSGGGKRSQISPYVAEPYLGTDMLHSMGELNSILNRMDAPVPENRRPTDLRWKLRKVTDKERDLPDAQQIIMGAIMVSEAFRDVAVQFDLGESQFIEAPLFEAKSVDRMGEVEIDPDRRDPRRWFLFHILPRKATLMPEASSGLYETAPTRFSTDSGGPIDIVLNTDEALTVPDVWRDDTIPRLIFFSDRLKRAIKSAKLRTPAFVFEPCRLA